MDCFLTYDVILVDSDNKNSYTFFRGHGNTNEINSDYKNFTFNITSSLNKINNMLLNIDHMEECQNFFENVFPQSSIDVYEITHQILIFQIWIDSKNLLSINDLNYVHSEQINF